jgi:hypothetical protein
MNANGEENLTSQPSTKGNNATYASPNDSLHRRDTEVPFRPLSLSRSSHERTLAYRLPTTGLLDRIASVPLLFELNRRFRLRPTRNDSANAKDTRFAK